MRNTYVLAMLKGGVGVHGGPRGNSTHLKGIGHILLDD